VGDQFKKAAVLKGDPTVKGSWQREVAAHDVVVNLAGASIFVRWTDKAKRNIRESRILTTQNLVEALSRRDGGNATLLSTSAVGYYGFRGDETLDESAAPGDDFLASVAKEWEDAAREAERWGVRVVLCRLGIVLSPRGGALKKMVPLFRAYLGSRLGSGKQWFSWIHMQDLVNAYVFLLESGDTAGPVNLTSPSPVTNRALTKALGNALGRPGLMPPIPGFAIRMFMGEFGSILIKGQRAVPARLLDSEFQFAFPELNGALADLLTARPE
jgi:hypothetical protein